MMGQELSRLGTSVVAFLTIVPSATGVSDPAHHADHHAQPNKRWTMYVKREGTHIIYDKHHKPQTAFTGKLVLVAPDGASERMFNFISGPWENGELPGLSDERYLRQSPNHSHAKGEPHVHYLVDPMRPPESGWCHSTGYGEEHRKTKAAPACFFLPLRSSAVTGRDSLGIHPVMNKDWGLAGTEGCIGIVDGDSANFQHFYKSLEKKGIEPTSLAVYTLSQRPPKHHPKNPGRGR